MAAWTVCRNFHGCNKNSSQQDVEEDQIQDENTPLCLSSSYYSVFVVRLAIMVMLAILIGLLTLLTWHITRVYTTRSLNTLASGLRHELLQRPVLRMWSVVNSTVEVATAQVKMAESVIRRYSKPVNQAEQIELYEVMKDVTWALFASSRALNSITLSYRNGFVQAFQRSKGSHSTYYVFSDLSNYSITASYGTNTTSSHHGWNDQSIRGNISAVWYREPLDPLTGERTGKPLPIPPDEPINIAGISQVPDGAASWHIAVSKYADSPLLSAALPVWDPSHKSIVAVVGVTTALSSVGQLMKELVEFHSGHIYLTSQEGWLIATSTNTPLLRNTSTGPKLTMAVDSEDIVIKSGAERLRKVYGSNIPPSQELHIENARLGHQLYYIDSFFLNLRRLPMVGVIIVPRKYIMGKVDEKAFKTLMVLISASVSILVVGCFCIFILTNGVSKEMKLRAKFIKELDARRKAEASSNYKSQFLANMSHELRTPMAAVIGLLDILMSDDCLKNEQHAMITQIRKCSTALLRLLNNILDLSKVESGKLILEENEFDLGRELEGLVDMFSVQCINHNVETVLDLSDDMPKLVQGDSGRVLQIFANLVSNSIKFTTSGYIVLRGWCEAAESDDNTSEASLNHNEWHKMKTKLELKHGKTGSKKDSRRTLWFEVDDTGCGIDPSKWESVFESFEQADPSTTRLHGGTGLGLCIVRNLVNKMNGEIRVVKKSGAGTVMQLYMLLNTPQNSSKQLCRFNLKEHNLTVLLALSGRMTRSVMTRWFEENGVRTHEASNWNELTQSLQQLFNPTNVITQNCSFMNSVFIIIIDVGLLDLSTEIWKQQLNFLEENCGLASFAWILSHDTSNAIKSELRKRGHVLMVNRPLYKAKIIQICEAVTRDHTHTTPQQESDSSGSKTQLPPIRRHSHDFLEMDTLHPSSASSDESEKSENESFGGNEDHQSASCSRKAANGKKSLEGLSILLAEDTPVLQRVATIMLEKHGAKVAVVGDGIQAVDSLKYLMGSDEEEDGAAVLQDSSMPYNLILMDCQMPKMDGYEATKAIRRMERGKGWQWHIPIVALTAHAMSCDEAKCLEVGMDAYLTKPIDCELMVSTILCLTSKDRDRDRTQESRLIL